MYEVHKFLTLLFRATIIPGCFIIPWLIGLITLRTVQICLLIFILVFVIAPIIFRYSISLQRGLLFLTFVTYPKDLNYNDPSSVGLYGTRNFYVKVKDPNVEDKDGSDGFNLGVWHVLPRHITKRFAKELKLSQEIVDDLNNSTDVETSSELEAIKTEFSEVNDENEKRFYESMLKIPGTVVLYFHGNTASRGSGHRVEIYDVLRKLGYHVLTFDYRSYGDSATVPPTEEGLVFDAMTIYNYVRNLTTNPIFFWGHSLGTGVSCHLLAQLSHKNIVGPKGLILESPFTNIRDEIKKHPFAKPFKDLPWFDITISSPMYYNSLRFESDQHITEFRQPVMILHAEDDYVVPFQLGYKLYHTAIDNRDKSWGPVEFHRFSESFHYGHKFICRAPELPHTIKSFIDNYRNENY